MGKLFGMELLHKQVLDVVMESFDDEQDWVVGDTPIERLFHAALVYRKLYGLTEYEHILTAPTPEIAESFRTDDDPKFKLALIVERQVQIGEYRVDFVVSAWTFGRVRSKGAPAVDGGPRWRKLVVECDGHDYHERTKEQAAKDRSRDRELNGAGYDVFRFTGSELWRDPWGCAEQVYTWALRGFG